MIFLTATVWMVLLMMPGSTTPFAMGLYSDKQDCEFVERQVREKLRPRTAVCVETPIQHAQ